MARLLIVEDHPELATLIAEVARSRGHEALAVHTGEAALAASSPAAFDAAIVDLLLPDMRGSAVLSTLRDHAIPAVAISGVFKGERFAREATEVHGARAFFEKPFELTQLLASVEQLCGLAPPPMPVEHEDEEVVVLEDLVPLEDDEPVFAEPQDEPVFSALHQDEPVFAAPQPQQEPVQAPPEDEPIFPSPGEPAPIVQGLVLVEEAPAPVMQLAPEEEEPEVTRMDIPLAEERPAPVLELVTPAPVAQDELTGEEDPHGEAPVPLEEPEPAQEVLVPPAEEHAVVAEARSPQEDELERLGELVALAPAEPPEPEPPPAEEEAPAPAAGPEPGIALPFGEREKVWAKTTAPGTRRRPPPEWSLSGDLKHTSIPRLLNAYYEARHSGELKLRHGAMMKVVYFEAGRLVYAASNLPTERFARFCLRRGVLPEARVPEVAALVREQNLRSSEAMMRLGLLDEQQHRQLLEEQVKEILSSTFSWTEGAYGYSPKRPPRAGLVKLSVFPGDIILEGVLKAESLVALRQRMPPSRRLFPNAAPPYGLHELKLEGQQALLLAYADGSKTVEDLLTLTDLPEREMLATLRALELLGVLEERREEPTRSRISFGL
ncbi:MAG TPA: DUF4388 domain-containing protein [Myxococcaceae bacterium]|nr:DUF4388 domain-containing protein [Myxococcaceae bacterium]